MTIRHKTPTHIHPDEMFPEFPPRDDMNNPLYLHIPAHMASLARHLGFPETTLVLGEVPVGWRPTSDRHVVLIPDLIVAFDIDTEEVIRRYGYSIQDIGKPPDFVLEVASPTTGVRDYTLKRARYAEFGIPEYWRFDHTGGEYHDAALAGDRLGVDGYHPIEIDTVGDRLFRGTATFWGWTSAGNTVNCVSTTPSKDATCPHSTKRPTHASPPKLKSDDSAMNWLASNPKVNTDN